MIQFLIHHGHAKNPVYRQIYNKIKEFILEHKLAAHEKLPSKRALAKTLKVSVNSITTAYEQLLAEGYIYAKERQGYYVEEIDYFILSKTSSEKERSLIPKETYPKPKEGWISLSHIKIDSNLFPANEWMKCYKKSFTNHQDEISEISHPQGPLLVRKTISDLIALTRGVKSAPEQIVIGPGTQTLISQLMTIQSESAIVGMENPGYARIHKLFKDLNLNVHPIGLDKHGISIKEIKKLNPTFLFVTPSHQFPTGTIMPVSRRIELLNWAAADPKRYIIEDDYDAEFKYGADNIPSLQSLDKNNSVIYVGSFSKTLLPSFRISYFVLPPKLLTYYQTYYANWIQGSSSLNLLALNYFIESGAYSRHLNRMTLYYSHLRESLVKALKQRFKQNIIINDIPAGLHFLATFKTNQTYEMIEKRAYEEKLELFSLKRYSFESLANSSESIQLILGFATLKKEEILEAVERLYKIIYS